MLEPSGWLPSTRDAWSMACGAVRQSLRCGWMLCSLVSCSLCACSTPRPAAQPPSQSARLPGSSQGPRVYLEAALLRVPVTRLGELASRSYSELAAAQHHRVLSAPRVLLAQDQRADYQLDGRGEPASSWRWTFESQVSGGRRLRLSLGLTREDSTETTEVTLELFDRQLVLLTTQLAEHAGEVLVIVLQPHVIEHPRDMQRILDSKHQASTEPQL